MIADIREWGLTEFCVPEEIPKMGLQFKHFPPGHGGVAIEKVTTASWAEKQGICAGDVVYAIGGKHADCLTGEQFVRLMLKRPLKLIIERLPKLAQQ